MKKALSFFGWPLLVLPALIMWTGLTFNEIAVHTNDAKMPVYVADCENFLAAQANPLKDITDDGETQTPNQDSDPVHTCMTKKSRFKILGDIIVSDDGISSIGDELIEFGAGEARWYCYLLWASMAFGCILRKNSFYLK